MFTQSQSGEFHPQVFALSHIKRLWDYNYDDLLFNIDVSALHEQLLSKLHSPQFTLSSMIFLKVCSLCLFHILTDVVEVTQSSTHLHKTTTCINDLLQTQLDSGISNCKIRYKLILFKKLLLQVDIIEFVFWVCCKLVIITTAHTIF